MRSVNPRQKTAVLLAYAFPPQNFSGARRAYRFAKYLPECGYATQVISGGEGFGPPGWDNVHCVPGQVKTRLRTEMASRLATAVQRYFLPYNDFLPWVPYAVAAGGEIAARESAQAVISTSPPIAGHLGALCLKKSCGLKWVADFRDPLFGNPFRTRKLGRLYDRAMERHIVEHADAVIANTDASAASLQKRYPRWSQKISVIWNGYDPEDVLSPARTPSRIYKVLTHAGTLYGGRHPGVLLDSMERLIARGLLDATRLRVKLIGAMNLREPWVAQSAFRSLLDRGCLEYRDSVVPETEARREIAESDLLLLLDLNESATALQVPAKLFEYLQVGRPILAFTPRSSPVERILSTSGVPHMCIHNGDAGEEIDKRVLAFLKLPSEPVVASRLFWEQFDARLQARTLAGILDGLLDANTPAWATRVETEKCAV